MEVVDAAVPPGIIGLADDVVRNVVGIQSVKKELRPLDVSAAINMNHDFGPRTVSPSSIDSIDPRIYQLSQVVPVGRKLSVRPHHSDGDFIAHLDHVREYAGITEGGDRVSRVLEHRFYQVSV